MARLDKRSAIATADAKRGGRSRSFLFAVAACFIALASPAFAQRGNALTASSFQHITYADIEKSQALGCSFSVFRGRRHIAFWNNEKPDDRPQFWFKIGGRMIKVAGEAKKRAKTQNVGVWTGTLAVYRLRIVEGRVDPTFRNDGDGVGGFGRMEWSGKRKRDSMSIRWQSGC